MLELAVTSNVMISGWPRLAVLYVIIENNSISFNKRLTTCYHAVPNNTIITYFTNFTN